MRKKWAVLFCMAVIGGVLWAETAWGAALETQMVITDVFTDTENNTVTVTGEVLNPVADQQVTLLVYPSGSDYTDTNHILHIDQCKITLEQDNAFNLTFPFDPAAEGDVTLRMGGTDVITPVTFDFNAGLEGVIFMGRVKYYNPSHDTLITLYQDGEIRHTTTIEAVEGSGQAAQNYAFEKVKPGNYTLSITKAAHLPYTKLSVIVDETGIILDEITLIPGDINGDGQIDSGDLSKLISSYGKAGQLILAVLSDLNGDGQVDSGDLSLLIDGYGKQSVMVP